MRITLPQKKLPPPRTTPQVDPQPKPPPMPSGVNLPPEYKQLMQQQQETMPPRTGGPMPMPQVEPPRPTPQVDPRPTPRPQVDPRPTPQVDPRPTPQVDPRPTPRPDVRPQPKPVNESGWTAATRPTASPMKKGGSVKYTDKSGQINLGSGRVSTHTPSKKSSNW